MASILGVLRERTRKPMLSPDRAVAPGVGVQDHLLVEPAQGAGGHDFPGGQVSGAHLDGVRAEHGGPQARSRG